MALLSRDEHQEITSFLDGFDSVDEAAIVGGSNLVYRRPTTGWAPAPSAPVLSTAFVPPPHSGPPRAATYTPYNGFPPAPSSARLPAPPRMTGFAPPLPPPPSQPYPSAPLVAMDAEKLERMAQQTRELSEWMNRGGSHGRPPPESEPRRGSSPDSSWSREAGSNKRSRSSATRSSYSHERPPILESNGGQQDTMALMREAEIRAGFSTRIAQAREGRSAGVRSVLLESADGRSSSRGSNGGDSRDSFAPPLRSHIQPDYVDIDEEDDPQPLAFAPPPPPPSAAPAPIVAPAPAPAASKRKVAAKPKGKANVAPTNSSRIPPSAAMFKTHSGSPDMSLDYTPYVTPSNIPLPPSNVKPPPRPINPLLTPSSSRSTSRPPPVPTITAGGKPALLTAEQKKANHIASEQKRRAAIREGYSALCMVVPSLKAAVEEFEERVERVKKVTGGRSGAGIVGPLSGGIEVGGEKVDGRAGPKSEAVVLSKTVEHLRFSLQRRQELLERLSNAYSTAQQKGVKISGGYRVWDEHWDPLPAPSSKGNGVKREDDGEMGSDEE